jgi:hypothetical protein
VGQEAKSKAKGRMELKGISGKESKKGNREEIVGQQERVEIERQSWAEIEEYLEEGMRHFICKMFDRKERVGQRE